MARRVDIFADPWCFGIRRARRVIVDAGVREPGLPNALEQIDRLDRAADGAHERMSVSLAAEGEFLGFATLGRRLRAEPDRVLYELDLMYLWVRPPHRGQGLGAAFAAAVGITALEDYRALARGARSVLPVSTLLFADFLSERGAAAGRKVVRALTEAGLAFVSETSRADVTLRLAPPRLVEDVAA
jgi:GNAT superfamily N-acetyltransferase